jgi:hypothetical protein
MISLILDLLIGPRYRRRFLETRPKQGETDAQYAKRLRALHHDSWLP